MSTVTIQAFDSTTVVYSGYMTKAPPIEPSKKTLKRWRKRYFVLHPNKAIEYYENDSQKVLKGALDLRECVHIEVGLFYKRRPNVIRLTTLRRKFFFQASSEMEMLYWAETIRTVKNAKEGEEITLPKLFHQAGGQEMEITRRTSFQDSELDDAEVSSHSSSRSNSDLGSMRDGKSLSRLKAQLRAKRKTAGATSPAAATAQQLAASRSLDDLQGGTHMYHFEPEQPSEQVQRTIRLKYRESMRRQKKTGERNVARRKSSSGDEVDPAYLSTGDELDDVFTEEPEKTPVTLSTIIDESAYESMSPEESPTYSDRHLMHPPIQTQEEGTKQPPKKLSLKKRMATTRGELPYFSESDDENLVGSPGYDHLEPKGDDALLTDGSFESGPTLRIQFLPSTLSHLQVKDPHSREFWEKVEFFAEMPSKVEFTHYAAYPFSYSGGSLQPGNSDILVHVPPGAISPYDNLFFPELSASSLWRPILVVNTRTCPDKDGMPLFMPATPIVKFTPSREVMGVLQPITFHHPISIRIPQALLPFSAVQSDEAELAILIATMNKEAQKNMMKNGGVFSNISFSVYPVNLTNPSDANEVKEVLKKKPFAVGIKDRYFMVFAKEVMMSLWIIGGTVQRNSAKSPTISPTGVPTRMYRELQLPMMSCSLKIFTKFSPNSRQHCVVAYLVENYHDALRTIETLCYKQEFSPCLKADEECSLELPMDSTLPILASIGRVKGQGYSIGTLEQDMMECDGCWKAAVFYIQFSYSRSTTLPRGGIVGLSLKIHNPKQVYVEKNFHLLLKSPI